MLKNNELRVSILGVCISLRIKHPEILKKTFFLYRDYLSTKKPHIVINVNYENPPIGGKLIYRTNEWALSKKNGRMFFSCYGDYPAAVWFDPNLNTKPIEFFSKDLEGRVLFFGFMSWFTFGVLLNKGLGAVFHACGVLDRKKGFFFVGPSGSGKTTIASLRGNRALLADYNILILKCKGCFKMFAHPWSKNKINLVSQEGIIINEIFFVEHAKNNFAIPINSICALKKLIKEALFYTFWDTGIVEKNLEFCTDLVKKIHCYRLGFVPNKSVWEFLSRSF